MICFSFLYSMICFFCLGVLAQLVWDQSKVSAQCSVEFVDPPEPGNLGFSHSLDIASHHGCSPIFASFSSSSCRDTSKHLFLLTGHPGHLFLSRPHHKVYMITSLCVDQTYLLTNAAECDKRNSPGTLGTVQELREERLWAAPCLTVPVRWHGHSWHAQCTWWMLSLRLCVTWAGTPVQAAVKQNCVLLYQSSFL